MKKDRYNKNNYFLFCFLLSLLYILIISCSADPSPISIKDDSINGSLIEPYLLYTGNNTEVNIQWQTETKEECTIEWGTDQSYSSGNSKTKEKTDYHLHSYKIKNLNSLTKYYYKISMNNQNYTGTFFTENSSNNGKNVSFFVYGDTRTNPDIHNNLMQLIFNTYTSNPNYQTFIIHTGDIVSDGNSEISWYEEFFCLNLIELRKILKNIFLIPCRGNHEENAELLKKYFPFPYIDNCYWSIDYGPAHIIFIDQYKEYNPGTVQYNWLENDLKSTTKTWKFLVFHEPGWSTGDHENNSNVQNNIQPLCENYDISMIFSAHNHNYTRALVNCVYHITTGGGGAPLYEINLSDPNIETSIKKNHFCKIEINDNILTFYAVSNDGDIIDSFTITK